MKRYRIFMALLAAGTLLWGGYRAWRAHANLVTLSVRNMEVRRVVSKIEWQTWERILVNKDVKGNVTLDVHNVPLEEVLNIVVLQTGSRWTALYPIYLASKSAVTFNKVVRGDIPPAGSGWSNFQKVPAWQRGGIGGFANTARAENKLVSAQILNKDLNFAALALSRFSQARVIPEDSAVGTINLKLEQAPFEKAVAQVAKQVHRKWDQIYALQPLPNMVMVRKEDGAGGTPGETNRIMMPRDEGPGGKEREVEAFLATMTPEERKQAQAQLANMQQLQSLPPAERQQQMQAMASQASQASQADQEQRIQNRLKNGTPEQRVAHDRAQLGRQRGPKQ